MGKVIHISDELHALVIDACRKEGIGMKEWAERVLTKFTKEDQALPPVPVPRKKAKLHNVDANGSGISPWQEPPFWEGGKRIDSDDSADDEGADQLEEERPGPLAAVGGDEQREPPTENRGGASEERRPLSSEAGGDEAA